MSAERAAVASPPGRVVRDEVVPPGEGWAEVVRQGQILRIVDEAGKQGVDFLCYHAAPPWRAPHRVRPTGPMASTG